MLKIELTLKSQKSSLDALTLKEKIDMEILDKLINSDLLKKTFHNPHSAKFYCNERDQLLDYRNLIKDGKKVWFERQKIRKPRFLCV